MYKFAIKNRIYNNKTVGYLYYDEVEDSYSIEIPDDVKSTEAPLILSGRVNGSLIISGACAGCRGG